MAVISEVEWSSNTLPATALTASHATSMLPNGDTNAVSTHTVPDQAAPRAAELPEEVWMQILGLSNDPVDLLHLSLASKRMQALTTRLLYENFDLVLASQIDDSLSRVLSSRNVGRDFMRRLTVSLDVEHDDDPRAPCQWLGVLLENLSPDKLVHFKSTSHRPLPQHLFKRLLETQRNLQHLEILSSGAVDDHYGPDTRDSRKDIAGYLERTILEKLDSIRVIPDRPQTAALCSIALHKSNPSTVHCLEVDARHWADAADFQHAQGMATKDQLVESLFAHLPRASPGQKGPFGNLTTLSLRDVKLDVSKYTWFTYLSLSKLQRLELRHCKAADIFLLQLTSGADVPVLKAFTMIHDVGEHSPDRSMEAIEQLLKDTGSDIVDLELCLRNAPRLPEVASIIPHGKSLRRLFLDLGSNAGSWNIASRKLIYDEDEFQDLLEPCVQLQQLAIALPNVSVEYSALAVESPEFATYITGISNYCQLETLSLLHLPTDYAEIYPRGYFLAKDKALARLAADIFAMHRSQALSATTVQSTSLQVIAFGTRERAENHLGPRYFVPSEVKALHKTKIEATQVSLADLQKNGLAGGVFGHERRDFDAASRRLFHPVEKEGQDWQGQEPDW